MVISENCLKTLNSIEKGKKAIIFVATPTKRDKEKKSARRGIMMMAEGPYRVVLADDHTMFRHGLKSVLVKKGDLDVIGEAGDGLELLTLLTSVKLAPHMAILDISMPNLGGLEATSKIKSAYPDMKVLILSMHEEKEYVDKALSVGADGYLLKQNSSAELFAAIEKIRRGGVYFSPLQCDVDRF